MGAGTSGVKLPKREERVRTRTSSYNGCCSCFAVNRPKCLSRHSSGMDEMSDVCDHEREELLAEKLGRIEIGPPEVEAAAEGRRKGKGKRPEMIRMRSLDGSSSAVCKEKRAEEFQEYELADDAIDELDQEEEEDEGQKGARSVRQGVEMGTRPAAAVDDEDEFVKIGCDTSDTPRKAMGKEELPAGVRNSQSIDDGAVVFHGGDKFATFPRMKKRRRVFTNRIALKNGKRVSPRVKSVVPTRKTKDGTSIYYWCDVKSRPIKGELNWGTQMGRMGSDFCELLKDSNLYFPPTLFPELDDGAYNPIWTSRGFTQSFHFWKENKRNSSTPLNALLTYVSLPWWNIAKDLLDKKDPPILTF